LDPVRSRSPAPGRASGVPASRGSFGRQIGLQIATDRCYFDGPTGNLPDPSRGLYPTCRQKTTI